ncbi:MAG TPA: HD-GYP domain-containing protein [Symbiobacteriaceae bacterium]|nr:HD-GYP domain-containing protein [Symbiobacteriaceae bacterium]
MLILPRAAANSSRMLLVISAAVTVGVAAAALIRLGLALSLDVPRFMATTLLPMLIVPWLWHWRKWPGAAWVEASAYVAMVTAAQLVMEVNVSAAFLVIPVLGVLHRDRGLTILSGALGSAAYGILLFMRASAIPGIAAPLLQFGADLVLQACLVSIYTGLIRLAEQAERTVVQAHMTEPMARQWAASIEARDQCTGGHVERVTLYVSQLAPHVPGLGMDLDAVRLASVLHDVGKIAVPDQILNKPGPLTAEEFQVMQSHTTRGYELVLRTDVPADIAAVVRSHHERWDGTGYPDRLQAEAIPLAARVLAVADAFDAMTSDRPYRAALSPAEARQRIIAGSGSQFDPAIVEVFLHHFPTWAALQAEHAKGAA